MSIDTDRRVRELEKVVVLLEARVKKLEEVGSVEPQSTLTLKKRVTDKAKQLMDSI